MMTTGVEKETTDPIPIRGRRGYLNIILLYTRTSISPRAAAAGGVVYNSYITSIIVNCSSALLLLYYH